MKQEFLLFASGGLAGVVGTWLLLSSPERATDAVPAESSVASTTARTASASLSTRTNGVFADTAVAAAELDEWQARVADDGLAALAAAAAISERPERRRAVLLVGRIWAQIDPVAALMGATVLPPELSPEYNASVATEWANLDAEAFLDFAEQTADLEALVDGLDLLIATDPERVYAIADRLTSVSDFAVATLMHDVQRAALHALADRDSAAAMGLIEPWLPRIDQSPLPQEIITRFARNDPDAAMAWLDSLDAVTNTHRRAVLDGIAQVDFARALEFASTIPGIYSDIRFSFARGALSDTTRTAEFASMLLNQRSVLANQVLQELVGTWAAREPGMLADWMFANAGALDAPLAQSIASRFAATDLELAMGLLERVPPHLSNVWVAEIAASYASEEPAAALDWIQQFQGQAIYDDLRSRVVMNAVNSDPDFAAAMVGEMSPALRATAVPAIAWALMERDPPVAADWASGLADAGDAASAVSRVVRGWVQRDVKAARSWAMRLARGQIRDQALYGLVAGSYGTNLDPVPVLDEIDDDFTRKLAQQAAMGNLSSIRPDVARELAEELLDDPLFSEMARETLKWLDGSGI